MSGQMHEHAAFMKFDNLKGPCEYTDFASAFVVEGTNVGAYAQSTGQVPMMRPLAFRIRGGNTHLSALQSATRSNQKTKLKQVTYTRCVYINGARKPAQVITLDNLTVDGAASHLGPGNGDQLIELTLLFTKITFKSTDYKPDGSILASDGPHVWDFEKGTFT